MNVAKEEVFLLNGKVISKEQAYKCPVLVPGTGFASPGVVYAFDSESSFTSWTLQTRHATAISEMMSKLNEARKLEGSDLSAVIEQKKLRIKRIVEDHESLAKRTGWDMGSEQFFLRATGQTHPLEDTIFDPLHLCANPGFTCAIPMVDLLPLGGGGWPDLGWVGWNDMASSYRISGFALLYEHIWWKGRAIFLAGHPVWADDLANHGFDNIASSAWVA